MTTTSEAGPRRALVFGGGGVLGFAWMLGAVSAFEEATGLDARELVAILLRAIAATQNSVGDALHQRRGATWP